MDSGGQYVMITGTYLTLKLCANSWDMGKVNVKQGNKKFMKFEV